MTKPWDETWRVSGRADIVCGEVSIDSVATMVLHSHGADLRADASLIAAAPAMARLLCRLEWSGYDGFDSGHGGWIVCPICRTHPPERLPQTTWRHAPDCALDAALTAAGLDAEERERVRGGK